jgi:hypothetical protein
MSLEDALASCLVQYDPVAVRNDAGDVIGVVHPEDLAGAFQVNRA